MARKEMSFEVFQNGHKAAILHIGANIGILNRHVTLYNLINSELPCCPDISYQVLVQYDI